MAIPSRRYHWHTTGLCAQRGSISPYGFRWSVLRRLWLLCPIGFWFIVRFLKNFATDAMDLEEWFVLLMNSYSAAPLLVPLVRSWSIQQLRSSQCVGGDDRQTAITKTIFHQRWLLIGRQDDFVWGRMDIHITALYSRCWSSDMYINITLLWYFKNWIAILYSRWRCDDSYRLP